MFLGGFDRDPRPSDLTSFAESAGYVDSSVAMGFVASAGSDWKLPNYNSPSAGHEWGIDLGGDWVSVIRSVLSMGGTGNRINPPYTPPQPRIQIPGMGTTGGGADRPTVSPELEEIERQIRERRAEEEEDRPVIIRTVPGGLYEAREENKETDFSIYGEAIPKTDEEDEPVAIDWGQILNAGIDIAQGQVIGGGGNNFVQSPLPAGGYAGVTSPPETVTVNTRTGKVTACKRRRRRRLLTPTDLSDLAALATIVGKGDALKLAVTKAVRR